MIDSRKFSAPVQHSTHRALLHTDFPHPGGRALNRSLFGAFQFYRIDSRRFIVIILLILLFSFGTGFASHSTASLLMDETVSRIRNWQMKDQKVPSGVVQHLVKLLNHTFTESQKWSQIWFFLFSKPPKSQNHFGGFDKSPNHFGGFDKIAKSI